MDTLILNSDGKPLSLLPLSVIDWQNSIKFEILDKVRVLKYHENWLVRSPSVSMLVPSIMMLSNYIKGSKAVKFTRYNIFLRDDFTCQLQITSKCSIMHGKGHGLKALTVDHIKPRSSGGKNDWLNLVTACCECNTRKGSNTSFKPKKIPNIPSFYEMEEKRKKLPIIIRDIEWINYLDWDEQYMSLRDMNNNIIKINNKEIDHDYRITRTNTSSYPEPQH
jgi:5-methylcytosine-specific restriction endonuclease McrA